VEPTPSASIRADAVLCDLDGTLVHTAPDLAYAAGLMLEDLGRPPVDEASVEGWIGDGVSRLVKRVLTGTRDGEPDLDLFERGYERFLLHYARFVSRRSRPYPGVREGLQALQAAGLRLACVTSKMSVFTSALLRDLDLEPFFAVVVAGDTLARKKPDPLPVLHACTLLGVEPHRAVLVGDSANDALAARAAGVAFAAVTYGYTAGSHPRELGADLLLDSLSELLPHLQPPGTRPGAATPSG
jgi:phosphoglycolate phosphatase